jgi:hypothetical protein
MFDYTRFEPHIQRRDLIYPEYRKINWTFLYATLQYYLDTLPILRMISIEAPMISRCVYLEYMKRLVQLRFRVLRSLSNQILAIYIVVAVVVRFVL